MLYSVDDSDDGALDRFKTKVQIKSSGTLMWMAPKIVSSSCKFDVTYFPFDRQVNFKLEGFLIQIWYHLEGFATIVIIIVTKIYFPL